MAYSLYRLKFSTGVHIGLDTGGASLDDGRMTVHSDTLFSALCCECAQDEDIARLHEYFSTGVLTISGTLPYIGDEYFLPKPVLFTGDFKREGELGRKKAFKAIEYIPLSAFKEYVKGLTGAEIDPERLQYNFGTLATYERVAIKGNPQPLPYHVAYWRFANDSGLYIIVRYENETALYFFTEILCALGLSGIGGKQTAGLGKFSVEEASIPSSLTALLDDSKADYQMLLGTALPIDEALDEALSGGWYATIRRGGFVKSERYAKKPLKKRTIYMLAPGSCLKQRFDGGIFDLSDGGTHPIWRCGKTLYAGVRL